MLTTDCQVPGAETSDTLSQSSKPSACVLEQMRTNMRCLMISGERQWLIRYASGRKSDFRLLCFGMNLSLLYRKNDDI